MSEWRADRRGRGRLELETSSWLSLMPFFVVVAGVLVVLLAAWLARQVEIDRCLDGGGRYLYAESRCEGATDTSSDAPQPEAP